MIAGRMPDAGRMPHQVAGIQVALWHSLTQRTHVHPGLWPDYHAAQCLRLCQRISSALTFTEQLASKLPAFCVVVPDDSLLVHPQQLQPILRA